jgi:hypothetical protein
MPAQEPPPPEELQLQTQSAAVVTSARDGTYITSSGIGSPAVPFNNGAEVLAPYWSCGIGSRTGTADLNGDDRADFWCYMPNNGIWAALNNGDGTSFTDIRQVLPASWNCGVGQSYGAADFNGDGRAEFWCYAPGFGAHATRNNGDGRSYTVLGQVSPGGNGWNCGSGGQAGAADLTGDGRAEFWCQMPGNGIWATRNTWTGDSATWPGNTFIDNLQVLPAAWNCHAGATYGAADLNGDRAAEFWCYAPGFGVHTTRNANDGTGKSYAMLGQVFSNAWSCGPEGRAGAADFNADGRADIWCNIPANGLHVLVNGGDGSGFTNVAWSVPASYDVRAGDTTGAADFTGDRKAEFWVRRWPYNPAFTPPAPISAYWEAQGHVNGVFGQPLAAATAQGVVTTQSFKGGQIHASAAGTYGVRMEFASAWTRAGGLPVLGYALSEAQALGEGFVQKFTGGEIYSSRHGTFAVRGPVLTRWKTHPQGGGATGELGFPVADETTYADGGRTQSFWNQGRVSTIASHPTHGTYLVRGPQWMSRGGPLGDNGWGTAIGWPLREERRYSDYPEMAPECSLHASRMYQQDFVAGTSCFFQDAAPQVEFLPHPAGDQARDCHKSTLNPYRNPDAHCFPTYNPPAVFQPPPAGWCTSGYTCRTGTTYASASSSLGRHCGCLGDFSPSSGPLSIATTSWSGNTSKKCTGHPDGEAACRAMVQQILDWVRSYHGPVGSELANVFDRQPSDVEISTKYNTPANAESWYFFLDKMVIHLSQARIMTNGSITEKDKLASYFVHEVTHLRTLNDHNGTVFGEVYAYLNQYVALREMGWSHCGVKAVNEASWFIWNMHYVEKWLPYIWSMQGLDYVRDRWYPNSYLWGGMYLPDPPPEYKDRNTPAFGWTPTPATCP